MRRLVVLFTVATLATTALVSPGSAAPPDDDCAPVLAVSAVTAGMRGTGYTVAQGTTRESFSVEVLGVLDGILGPGRDLILANLSGGPIDRAGGPWAGISGSPVYVGDRLLGSVSYMATPGSTIAGLTPGQDVVDVLDLPVATTPATVKLDARTQDAVAKATNRTLAAPATLTLHPVPMPMGISGLSTRRVGDLRSAVAGRELPFLPYAASSASLATQTASATVRAGDNIVGALAYGDVSAWGGGTATYVCDGQLMAFGHPMLYTGNTTLGANTASTVAVIPDPVWGSWEEMRIGGLVGMIDQDRFGGIRTLLGDVPDTMPATSTIRDLDTGRARDGRTDIVMKEWAADLAINHVLANFDTVIDRYGKGSSTVDTTVRGVTESGVAFSYRRGNVFVSDYDIAFDSSMEFYSDLWLLQFNGLEDIEFTGVDVRASVQEALRRYTITAVAYSPDGVEYLPLDGWGELYVPSGATLQLRVTLDPGAGEDVVVDLALDVPAEAAGPASLDIRGGQGEYVDPYECMFDPQACVAAGEITGVMDLVEYLQSRARNDELVASLAPFDFGPEGLGAPTVVDGDDGLPIEGGTPPVFEVRARQDRVVSGFFGIPVFIEPSGGDGDGPIVTRYAGQDRIETAVRASAGSYPETGMAPTVVLASADDFADALAGAPLAAKLAAPLLLTAPTVLPGMVAQEIQRLGATRAIVLGGPAAVSDGVMTALRELGLDRVDRIAGTNRYDTARLIALRVGGDHVLLARGAGTFADAVAASGIAAQQGRPLLLTDASTLPPPTVDALRDLGVTDIRVVGGTAVIGSAVTQALMDRDYDVERIAGPDRYATSATLARIAIEEGADPSQLFVATGRAFPDGLVAGALTGGRYGVLLLVDGIDVATNDRARQLLGEMGAPAAWTTVTVVGGTAAVRGAVVDDLTAALPTSTGGGDLDPGVG